MAVVRGAEFKVEGLEELDKQFERIGKMPKKYLTRSAKLGMDKPYKEAKSAMPEGKTGLLRKGLTRQMETPNKKRKTIYRLRWHPKFTTNYRKKTTGVYGGETPHTYYPNAWEYGHKTKKGRVEGKYVVRDIVEKNTMDSLEKIIKSLNASITELAEKG